MHYLIEGNVAGVWLDDASVPNNALLLLRHTSSSRYHADISTLALANSLENCPQYLLFSQSASFTRGHYLDAEGVKFGLFLSAC
jgi:hypothetical protein